MTHDELKELVPGFALGALEPAEMAAFQQHVSACGECARNVVELETLVGTLPLSAAEQALPIGLKDRLLRAIRTPAPGDSILSRLFAGWRPVLIRTSAATAAAVVIALVVAVAVLAVMNSRPNEDVLASQEMLDKSYDALAIMAKAEQWWGFEGSEASPNANGSLAYSSHHGKACLMIWGLPTAGEEHYDAYGTINGASAKVGYLYPTGSALWLVLDGDPARFDLLEVSLIGPGGSRGPVVMNLSLSESRSFRTDDNITGTALAGPTDEP